MPSDEDSVWSEKTLADLSEKSRYGINAKASGNADGPKFLRITDIVPDSIDWLSVPHCDVSADDFVKYQLQPGDLVIARSGSVGYAKQISESDPAAVFASYLVRFRALPEVDADFLAAIVCSAGYRSWVLQNATGVAQPNANAQILGSFPIRVPPIPVQKRIGSLATTLNRLIECNRRRIELLEETARLLYREWFVHFRYPGHEDVPLVDSELGPIPQGWETRQLSDLVSTQYGYTESATEDQVGPKYLRGMDINKSSFIDWAQVPYCPIEEEDIAKFAVVKGDVFIIRMADPGKVGICETNENAVFASYLVRLRPRLETLTPYFLFYSLSDNRYQDWITGASTGATRRSISAKVMVEPALTLPPADLMQRFEESVGQTRSLLTILLRQNDVLKRTRDLLLPRLVSGDLDISDLDLDLEAVG